MANVGDIVIVESVNLAGEPVRFGSLSGSSYVASIKSPSTLTGGGVVSVSVNGDVSWSTRFLIISNGRGSHFSTIGYFDIAMPAVSTVITGVGGAANKTVSADGIRLAGYEALYYILPIGSSNASVPANFRVVSYTSNLVIPETWVLLALRSGDNNMTYFPALNGRLPLNSSINVASYDSRRALFADAWNTARTLTIGASGKSVNGSANVTWTLGEIGAAADADVVKLSGDQNVNGTKTFGNTPFFPTIAIAGKVNSLGSTLRVPTGSSTNFSVTDNSIPTGAWRYDTSGSDSGGPFSERGVIYHAQRTAGGGETQFFVGEATGRTASRGRVTGAWSAWLESATTNTTQTISAVKTFTSQPVFNANGSTANIGTGTGGLGAFQVQSSGIGNGAFITFHIPGDYAFYFGMDSDRKLKIGGWSMGAVSYEILHSSNYESFTGLVTPQNKTASYTLVLADMGRGVVKNTTTAITFTIPPNVFPAGAVVTFLNNAASGDATIAQGSGVTIRLAGGSTSGNRTLSPYGLATAWHHGSNLWFISGAGVS